jgi:hypothetical protein
MTCVRQRRYVIVLVAFALAATACDSNSGSAPPNRVALPTVERAGFEVVAAELRPAGSAIDDGFRVPAGAAQLGPALPDDDVFPFPVHRAGHVWTATLLVERDPGAVFDALVNQARAHGLNIDGAARWCGYRTPAGEKPAAAVRSGLVDGWMGCSVNGVTGAVSAPDREVSISLERGGGPCGNPNCQHGRSWSSQVTVSYGEARGAIPVHPWPPLPRHALPDVRVRRDVVPLQRAGDQLHLFPSATDLRVAGGSTLLAPFQGSETFTLRVTGNRDAVWRRYRSQIARQVNADNAEVLLTEHARRGAWAVTTLRWTRVLTIERFQRTDGRSPEYLRVVLDTD